MSMKTCQTCTQWVLENTPLPGMAPCKLGKPWTFFPPQHTCPRHTPATAQMVALSVKALAVDVQRGLA
jgi:hypothetical protein